MLKCILQCSCCIILLCLLYDMTRPLLGCSEVRIYVILLHVNVYGGLAWDLR